jgi:O-antigen/teichoic acid export membrane protein
MQKKATAIFLGTLNLFLQNGYAFLLTPIMLSIWGQSYFGLYKLLLTYMTYFMLIDTGMRNSITRFISEYRADHNKHRQSNYLAFLLLFYTFVSIILILVTFGFGNVIPEIYSSSLTPFEIDTMMGVIPLIAIYSGGTLFFNCLTAILRAYNAQSESQILNLIKGTVRFIAIVILIYWGKDIKAIFFAEIGIVFVTNIIAFLIIVGKFKITPRMSGINFAYIRELFSFTSIMFVETLAFAMFWSLDNIILSFLTTTALVGIYAVGSTITNLFQAFSGIISQVIVPDIMVLGHKTADQDILNNKMIQVARLKFVWMLLPALGFISFGKSFIHLWLGEGYTEVYYIVLIVLVPQIIGLIQDVPANIMYVRNKQKPMAWFSLIAAIMNLVLTIFLVQKFGIIGAAIGTFVAYTLVYIFFTGYYYSRYLNFDMKGLYMAVIIQNYKILILFIIISALLSSYMISSILLFIVTICAFTSFYLMIIWKFMMNDNEKTILRGKFPPFLDKYVVKMTRNKNE